MLLCWGIIAAVKLSQFACSARFLFANQQTQQMTVTKTQPKAVGLSPNSTWKKNTLTGCIRTATLKPYTVTHIYLPAAGVCFVSRHCLCSQTNHKEIHTWVAIQIWHRWQWLSSVCIFQTGPVLAGNQPFLQRLRPELWTVSGPSPTPGLGKCPCRYGTCPEHSDTFEIRNPEYVYISNCGIQWNRLESLIINWSFIKSI